MDSVFAAVPTPAASRGECDRGFERGGGKHWGEKVWETKKREGVDRSRGEGLGFKVWGLGEDKIGDGGGGIWREGSGSFAKWGAVWVGEGEGEAEGEGRGEAIAQHCRRLGCGRLWLLRRRWQRQLSASPVNSCDLAEIDTHPHGLGVCCCSDTSSQHW